MFKNGRCSWRARVFSAAASVCLLATGLVGADLPWAEKDSRLAGEYLNLLVEKPEYGRVLDLLWDLYDKHGATNFLLESIAKQAEKQPHENVLLVHAHLLRKASQLEPAVNRYVQVLRANAKNATALRALADISISEGNRSAAIGYLQKLSETLAAGDPAAAKLFIEMGRVQLESGKPADAGALWDKAMKLSPDDRALTREVAQLMLGAGMLDRALVLYRQLVKTGEPAKRLDALFELARMEEQADHFPEAVAALREGLAILHFKDWRYQQFFLRLVKAHERFGQLDVLKEELLKAAKATPPTERALVDIARFSELTVESEERIQWLRELVKLLPDAVDHRLQLVALLIDHDGAAEAAKLLDAMLKNDGTDLPSMVLLRCQTHLRAGEQDAAAKRLRKLYEVQGENADVEKQALAFARENALDDITELVMKARIARDPEKADPVFELASYYKGRNDLKAMNETLEAFAKAPAAHSPQDRLNQVATFLSATNDAEAAEAAARQAASFPQSGSEEHLRLADALITNGKTEEAQSLLERAWNLCDSAEKRTDVDERLFSLLAGDEAPRPPPNLLNSAEFKMPAMFTGQGFGSDAPVEEKKNTASQQVIDYANALALQVLLDSPSQPNAWAIAAPLWLGSATDPVLWRMVRLPEKQSLEAIQRAAWWCLRSNQIDLAYLLMQRLLFDSQGARIVASMDVEKLLLDIAMADHNRLLISRQLNRITELDPANKAAYRRRLCEQYLEIAADPPPRDEHERAVSAWFRAEATKILENMLREDPQNESVISALAQCYTVDGRRDKALGLWQRAAETSKGNATPMLERYADALISQRRFKEFLETQARILEAETDVKRRREIQQRALERLMFVDSFNGDLPEDEKKKRLDLVAATLEEQARRHPFDGFWHEALAGALAKAGETAKAFAEMKQAYYTSPDTPFSLDQLRAAALKAGDLKSAIYFQKQVAAAAEAKDQAGEWRQLVQLLEEDFRMAEADQARRRLEARIAQDPVGLEELAKYYNESGQDDAARRVQEQITRVKGWDGRALLRLALTQEQAGNPAEAVKTLVQLLGSVTASSLPDNGLAERLPWPLLDDRQGTGTAPAALLNAIENAPAMEPRERERIRVFLSLPRAELTQLPEEPSAVRLRAIEQLAKLDAARINGLERSLSEREKVWAAFYGGDGPAFRQLMAKRLAQLDRLEAQFLFVWLGLRSHGVGDVLGWVRQKGLDDAAQKSRRNLLLAVVAVLSEDSSFAFTPADVTQLGSSPSFSFPESRALMRKLVNRRQYDQALALGEAARVLAPSFRTAMDMMLAEIAGMAGQPEKERRYLLEAWSQPLQATRDISSDDLSGVESDRYIGLAFSQMIRAPIPSGTDPFSQSFIRLWRQASTAEEREGLLRRSWSRLQQSPATAQNTLRAARILGVTGAMDRSGQKLADYFSGPFLATRPFSEPLYKNLPKGTELGPRIDELNHLRDYWRDGIEWGLILQEEGLGAAAQRVDEAIEVRNAGTAQGPKSNYEFGSWKNQALVRKLRGLSFSERLRVIRAQLQSDESVETIRDLGGFLEGQGFSRESIEVYRRLPPRAPSNSEYSESFVRACEVSWDFLPALPYLERLFDPATDPVFKPLTLNFEVLRERHAHFLFQMHDEARLKAQAYRMEMPKLVQNRIPEPVPYLKELALLLERNGDKAGALAAWEQLHTLWQTDHEATLHRALLLREQGNKKRALEALRDIPLDTAWSEATQRALPVRASLVAEAGLWDEMRELMNAAAGSASKNGNPSPLQVRGTISLTDVLVQHDRKLEALSLLVRAERAAKDEVDRNRLRLEQIKLASLDPAWTPAQAAARLGALFRLQSFDSELMKSLMDWLKSERTGPRAKAWISQLKPHAATEALGALALSVFSGALGEDEFAALSKPWAHVGDSARAAQLLAVEQALEAKRPALAYQMALAGRSPLVVESPTMVRVLAAMKDRHGLDELFARKIRQNFPGGQEVIALAEAFDAAGRGELAEELYVRRLEHVHATANAYPQLVAAYARHLINARRFEQAETLLVKENDAMTKGLAELLTDLYRGWGRLDRIGQELKKFQLPIGVEAEALFLASRKPQS
jgi:Tfp pilus assembly protein PilF/thioredoxin-like negative regulator of GroEL